MPTRPSPMRSGGLGVRAEPIVRVEVLTHRRLDQELDAPSVPKLVGVSELAEMLGVTRQRVNVLRRSTGFPEPTAELKAGPVWTESRLARYVGSWNRRPGRRTAARPESYWSNVISEAMAIVGEVPAPPQAPTNGSGAFTPFYACEVHRQGQARNQNYFSIEFHNAPDDWVGIGGGPDLDWLAEEGSHRVAALVLAHAGRRRPSAPAVEALANQLRQESTPDGLWSLELAAVEQWLSCQEPGDAGGG